MYKHIQANRFGEHGATGVAAHLVGGDDTQAQQVADDGVILGEAGGGRGTFTTAHQVSARVADVGQVQAGTFQASGGEGRAHARRAQAVGFVHHGQVGGADRAPERGGDGMM